MIKIEISDEVFSFTDSVTRVTMSLPYQALNLDIQTSILRQSLTFKLDRMDSGIASDVILPVSSDTGSHSDITLDNTPDSTEVECDNLTEKSNELENHEQDRSLGLQKHVEIEYTPHYPSDFDPMISGNKSHYYIEYVMQRVGKPMEIPQLIRSLQEMTGFQTSSEDQSNTLRNAMTRKSEIFRKFGYRHWGLKYFKF